MFNHLFFVIIILIPIMLSGMEQKEHAAIRFQRLKCIDATGKKTIFGISNNLLKFCNTLKNMLEDYPRNSDEQSLQVPHSGSSFKKIIPYLKALERDKLQLIASQLAKESFGNLLKIAQTAEYLEITGLMPLIYQSLYTKFSASKLRNLLCSNSHYASMLEREIPRDLQSKIVSNEQTKIDILELCNAPRVNLTGDSRANSLEFSKDGKFLFTGSFNGAIDVLDIQCSNNYRKVKSLKNGVSGIYKLKRTRDGNHLISIDGYGMIRFYNIQSPSSFKLIKTIKSTAGWIHNFRINKKGNFLYSFNDGIDIWDISNICDPKFIKNLYHDHPEHDSDRAITMLCISSDDKYLFAGSQSGIIKIWNIENGQEPVLIQTLNNNTYPVRKLVCKNNILISSFANGESNVWDVTNMQNVRCIKSLKHNSYVENKAIFTNDNNFLFFIAEKSICIFKITKEPDLIIVQEIPIGSFASRHLMSKDNNFLISYTYMTGNIKIWDISNLPAISLHTEIKNNLNARGCSMKLSANNSIIFGLYDGGVAILRLLQPTIFNYLLLGHKYVIDAALAAQKSNTKLDFTKPQNHQLYQWHNSMDDNLKTIINPYCKLSQNNMLLDTMSSCLMQ